MDLARFQVDLGDVEEVLGKCEFYITSSIQNELKSLAGRRGKKGVMAKAALKILERRGVKVLEIEGKTDEVLFELGRKDFLIATNDSKLRRRLKEIGKRVMYLKSLKRVEVE